MQLLSKEFSKSPAIFYLGFKNEKIYAKIANIVGIKQWKVAGQQLASFLPPVTCHL